MRSAQYILNEAEARVKAELWMRENAEYLREQRGMCPAPTQAPPGARPSLTQCLSAFQRKKHGLQRRRSWVCTRSRR